MYVKAVSLEGLKAATSIEKAHHHHKHVLDQLTVSIPESRRGGIETLQTRWLAKDRWEIHTDAIVHSSAGAALLADFPIL